MESEPTPLDRLTPTQRRVVAERGNVLVMAGAGTGKTTTLVERCLDCLARDGAAVDEMLIVTFTEAAAAEMRERLRRAIEGRVAAGGERWAEQLARFDLAHIGTLHSFCLKLVREHFYELGLDPRLTLLDEGEARQLANEVLEGQFTEHYAGEDEFSAAVQDLIQSHGGGRDEPIQKLVLQLHHYSQARPDAAGWLAREREKFAAGEPADWREWLRAAVQSWGNEWLPVLKGLGANEKALELTRAMARLAELPAATWREIGAEALTSIVAGDGTWPKGRKTLLRKPLETLFDEAGFLQSLVVVQAGKDPLAEDWEWVRGQMATLLRLAEEFAGKLAERKQANGVLDFHDLEQYALKLLWDFATGQPTSVAAAWRAKLKFVFVDEYQDINAAQDRIIAGLSREGAGANRFLVGDVKQSIYRFRLADPQIFRDYARQWRDGRGRTIALSENFRSREGLLKLVNAVFRNLMREEVGGVGYDADAELKFGAAATPGGLPPGKAAAPCAELLVRFKNGRGELRGGEDGSAGNLDDTQREARMVAWRLKQLLGERLEVFDSEQKVLRPVKWRDMAILLRSPRGRSEVFAKEFERAGIPLAVARGGFYQSAEILDLLSLLQLLDNPLQDEPCIAVLRSPLVGLTLDELAEVRLAANEGHFWTALNRAARAGLRAETTAKISRFLERYGRWRRLAKLVSLAQGLEEVLAETLYGEWLRAQPRGAQRAGNVTGFVQLAQQFDQFQRQGLYRFLKFIEAQQEAEAEPEVPAAATEDAVRLMSIHQSKGLEFPVVVLADLAKGFNEQDLRGEIIFDEEFGLCPKVKPPHVGGRYPSLPHWLARRQKRELRGEELRLLYVAVTRARDHLILSASIPEKQWNEKWVQPQAVTTQKIAAAKSFADWLALWFSGRAAGPGSPTPSRTAGAVEDLQWRIVADEEAEDGTALGDAIGSGPAASGGEPADGELGGLRARLEWSYPFAAATQRKAKSSVTALRREAEERDEEAEGLFPEAGALETRPRRARKTTLNAAEIGAAHHKFLEHVALEQVGDLAAEAERLVRENYLSAEERAVLDLAALAGFWNSPLGRRILAEPAGVRREVPFTARFSPEELAKIVGAEAEPGLAGGFVIVQGVADLVVLRAEEIWVVDFKTDEVSERGLAGKVKTYAPQLRLYASALEKIFGRAVTLRALHFFSIGRTEEV